MDEVCVGAESTPVREALRLLAQASRLSSSGNDAIISRREVIYGERSTTHPKLVNGI